MSEQPKTAFCDNQRLWDLLRLQRHSLFESNAISDEEYALLVTDHAAVERLESYDSVRAQLAERIKLAERLAQDCTRELKLRRAAEGELKRALEVLRQAAAVVHPNGEPTDWGRACDAAKALLADFDREGRENLALIGNLSGAGEERPL